MDRCSPACSLTVVAWGLSGLTMTDLWWRYVGDGGNHGRLSLADYPDGRAAWTSAEHNFLAHALNEALWDLDCPSLAPTRGQDGPREGVSGACVPGPPSKE